VRLPVEKPQAAVDFLHARSEGVMDLIAHFWERLSQTPPLSRGDLHLVVSVTAGESQRIDISTLDVSKLSGAMLYVPKAHRADVLALYPEVAAAFSAYIRHQGSKTTRSEGEAEIAQGGEDESTKEQANGERNGQSKLATAGRNGQVTADPPHGVEVVPVSDLSASMRTAVAETELPIATGKNGTGRVPIDFLTGQADGIAWMTPWLLPAVNRKSVARQMVNVVMQLPADRGCKPDSNVRVARESDVPMLNRWRRQYKEERGILFDADLDAWVQTQRVFVYEHDKQVVAVAKFDLELGRLIEIGGVYTFPEYRTRGFGAKIVSDLACRIRQGGKVPTLQVDVENGPALRLYEAMGWRVMGKLARVWLTG
jgi:GNAT superfamily N-acetyltransferase